MRAKKPQVYPQRYIEDFFAKHDEVAAPDRVPQQQKLLRPVLILFTQFINVDATLTRKATVAGIFALEAAIYWPLLVIILQSKSIRYSFERFQQYADRGFGAILVGLGMKVALA